MIGNRQIKALERERQEIDAELQRIFPSAQLRHGIKATGGWMLQERSRSRWEYAPEVQQAIKQLQSQAQRNGSAERLMSTYLCLSKEDSALARLPSVLCYTCFRSSSRSSR